MRGITLIFTLAATLLLSVAPDARQSAYRIKLIDAATGKHLAGRAARLYSDNGVRCIKAPCATNGKEWNGETDGAGVITLSSEYVQASMTLTAAGYGDGATIDAKALKAARGVYVVKLKAD